ncbi:Thiol-disulfide isomerase or thioredoxin [Salegentibacter echinorum]|uniref:Thiol-disulfide isomerase or thioredoxin n=1 Tax=Salegentibacter echinorum TaxID=1073325 RepID=A0A1M5L3Z6_SALEC|nr:redoxin domain-containing protein [Salegentibacter echinorum]SHG59738.1 Thiol-disulfide isomerase or thioredoxin [Salegentibacter echinorum]
MNSKWIDGNKKPVDKLTTFGTDKYKIGNELPDISFLTLDGEEKKIQDKGKAVFINWCNTGCAHCITEMPGLNSLVEDYVSHPGVLLLVIARNTSEETSKFLQRRDFDYMQFVNEMSTVGFFEPSYPKHFIIGKEGEIQFFAQGGSTEIYKELNY